jgi:hypothetical protein
MRHNCPICLAKVNHWERYPNQVCEGCADWACDREGRRLRFSNANLTGGFIAFYADTNEKYYGHICYIDGIKCYADEHRFGGIVVEVVR